MSEGVDGVDYIYAISNGNGLVKIGRSRHIDNRFSAIQKEQDRELNTLRRITNPPNENYEALLHQRFAPLRVDGEWFKMTDSDVRELMNVMTILDTEGPAGLQELDGVYV